MQVNATVRKTSAGAADTRAGGRGHQPGAHACATLQQLGVWMYGLAGEADASLYAVDLRGNVAPGAGRRGRGHAPPDARALRRAGDDPDARRRCESLNVSVAAGVDAVRGRAPAPGLSRLSGGLSPPAPPRPRRRAGDDIHLLAHRPQVDHVGFHARETVVVAADPARLVAGHAAGEGDLAVLLEYRRVVEAGAAGDEASAGVVARPLGAAGDGQAASRSSRSTCGSGCGSTCTMRPPQRTTVPVRSASAASRGVIGANSPCSGVGLRCAAGQQDRGGEDGEGVFHRRSPVGRWGARAAGRWARSWRASSRAPSRCAVAGA